MSIISVRPWSYDTAHIEQLPAIRDWMDASNDKHAYMCFPLTLTNRMGWGISFPEDIVFIWDGVDDTTPDHVRIIKGHKWANTKRGNATISFETGLVFKTNNDVTILTMPVPNQFISGTQCFTALISTSFYHSALPVAWKITEANKEITIPAGTPVTAVLPMSLTALQNDYELRIDKTPVGQEYWEENAKYGQAFQEKTSAGGWSKMYRDALDYNGNKIGEHETKSIKLKTVTCPVTGATYTLEEASNDRTKSN